MVAAGIGALAGTAARAESSVDFRTLYYGEGGGRTQVINPEMLFQQDFGDKGQLGVVLSYDSISGASPTGAYPSVDATVSASGVATSSSNIPMAEYRDHRKATILSYSNRIGPHIPSVDLSYSRESDYLSKGVSLVDSWDLFGKRSTFHFGAGILRDNVLPVHTNDNFPKKSLSLSAGWTQVMGPRDLLDFSFGVIKLNGYLTEPYKVVPVVSLGTTVHEIRPDTRMRNSAVVKYGHYFLSKTAVKISYRYYWDDWSLKAHTLEVGWDRRFGDRFIVSPRLRFYQQGAASFFAYQFDTPQTYMSSDYRLSAFWSWLLGLGFRWDITETFALVLDTSFTSQTGTDRVTPISTAVPLFHLVPGSIVLDQEDTGGGGPTSVSAADLQTTTVTVGFSIKF